MKGSLPRKFKSIREKNGSHRRNKSSEPSHKGRPLSSDVFFSYFKSDAAKQAAKEEDEKEKLALKIESISSRIDELRFHNISKDHMRFALLSKYADGDVDKAIELIQLQQQAFSGILLPYNPNTEMVGAENRSNVTCYLDALLFAMYAKLGAFECMLKNDLPNDGQRNLAALLRLWVNMLRSGKLIRTDMTATIQEALADCGWKDARLLEQQDTSEAFAFITETLQLPLLTLQVDLFHQGEHDDDDHKVVYERLLNLAVPPDPEGKGVKLEDCLEDYFNTKVDVLRDGVEEKKAAERRAVAPEDTIRLVPADDMVNSPTTNDNSNNIGDSLNNNRDTNNDNANDGEVMKSANTSSENGTNKDNSATNGNDANKSNDTTAGDMAGSNTNASNTNSSAEHTAETTEGRNSESFDRDPAPVKRRWTMLEPYSLVPENRASSSSAAVDPRFPAAGRQRSASIIQRIVIEDGKPSTPEDSSTFLKQFKRQGSTIIKAVTIPAWQFFRLIPWHSTSNNQPQNDIDVARQFNQRPVVGICLKRYMMNESGQFLRQNTYIDIPDSLRLPYFMMAENGRASEENELSSEYKLVLQSVVCHRGMSLHSGHYISFARVNPKLLTDNRRHDSDPPPDYEEEQWVKFDDLAVDNRVTYVDDIKAALKAEMPYLLFYQIMPMVDISPSSTDVNEVNDPPSYNALTNNLASTSIPAGQLEADRSDIAPPETVNGNGSYFDVSTWGGSTTTVPSVRFSSELERPPRISLDDDSNASLSVAGAYRKAAEGLSRRGSAAFTSSIGGTPIITPEGGRSPVITPTTAPAVTPSDETSTAQRLSRAAARLTGKSVNRSRPQSQAGEGRISLTMSRLGGLMRTSKELLRHSEDGLEAQSSLTVASAATTPGDSASVAAVPAGLAPVPNMALTTVVTAPAASSTTDQLQGTSLPTEPLPQALPSTTPQQQQQQDQQGQPQEPDGQLDGTGRHHHHRHHHPHLRRGKSKSRQEKDVDVVGINISQDGAENSAAVATGNGGKGKEKEKVHEKRGVPERECSVM